ncbi:hypothetical protein [Caballeronia sp. AZ10_KS36]|uniref:hypothetical protein n=1 Tax=Caballeronia sp. AZ10_KS36 TaxID=2921757 RepID=UPI002027940E|nr:hypothetical protein [Caballeronia sp. AZ10_KS36]
MTFATSDRSLFSSITLLPYPPVRSPCVSVRVALTRPVAAKATNFRTSIRRTTRCGFVALKTSEEFPDRVFPLVAIEAAFACRRSCSLHHALHHALPYALPHLYARIPVLAPRGRRHSSGKLMNDGVSARRICVFFSARKRQPFMHSFEQASRRLSVRTRTLTRAGAAIV